jgi:HEAT repeat protein
MAWQGVEIEIEVPCAGGQKHPVRLRFTGWGEYEVAYNPCEELLGPVFARMAACTHYLHEKFPEAFRNDTDLKRRFVEAFGAAGAPAVPALIQALGDRSENIRRAAAEALGELGDPQAVPALSVWAHAGEDAARDALQTLGHPMLDLPQAVAQVAAQGAWGVLIRALTCAQVREVVVGLGAPAAPALIQALGDSDGDVRRAAATRARLRANSQGDSHSAVRRAAAEALGKLGDPQAVPALSVWAHAGEDAARDALQTLGHPMLDLPQAVAQVAAQGAWGVLIRALTCAQVREVVVGLGAPAVPALIQALGDSDSAVRRAAAEALGDIGDPQAVPALIQALGDSDWDVRWAAAKALGKLGDPQAIPALIQALGDSDWDVRFAAAWALGNDVRFAAAWALGAIGDPPSHPRAHPSTGG